MQNYGIARSILSAGCAWAFWAGTAVSTASASETTIELELPDGFSATVFHPGVEGRLRYLAVAPNGVVYAAIRDGELAALKDTDGDGVFDEEARRALPISTGARIYKDYIYIADRVSVSRLPLPEDGLLPEGEPETIVDGFPEQRAHASKSFTFDEDGGLYVNVGVPSNACQEQQRTLGSPGQRPCPELDWTGGVWKFDAETPGQTQSDDGELIITGSRHGLALDWHEGALITAVHGRDQLDMLWPDIYDAAYNAENPAEEFHIVRGKADFGWPYTYYNPQTNKRMVAPEYGGDGATVSEEDYKAPDYAFPGHWAPNDLIVYEGDAFPDAYDGGAFIAFHGSWNRAPLPQQGFKVVFLPLKDGAVAGEPFDFATGFPGEPPIASPRDAVHRPTGLAQGPDGALYVADSMKGRIWKITYDGE